MRCILIQINPNSNSNSLELNEEQMYTCLDKNNKTVNQNKFSVICLEEKWDVPL